MQVTVQNSGTKISHTVKGAIDHGIANENDRLTIFFLLPEKPAWPRSLEGPTDIVVNTMDIADLTQLVGQIEDIAKLERVANVVELEVGRNLELYRQANMTAQPTLRSAPMI